jgi:exodeoxyribonuclease V beta subunit
VIQTALRKYRFSDAWIPVVLEMIGKVAGLALGPDAAAHAGDAPPMRLSSVPPKERINEMAFYFPLRSVPPRRLASVFAQHGIAGPSGDFPERIGRLEFSRKAGYMKGFIDLVFRSQGRFWVVDWKSNHLGDQPEDYRPEVLQEVMAEDFYILQYHLYTLALHRYLQLRLPGYDYDTHFGGVRYLFLRGITSDDAAPFGMFQDRPQAAVIHALDALLVDAPAGGAPAAG